MNEYEIKNEYQKKKVGGLLIEGKEERRNNLGFRMVGKIRGNSRDFTLHTPDRFSKSSNTYRYFSDIPRDKDRKL